MSSPCLAEEGATREISSLPERQLTQNTLTGDTDSDNHVSAEVDGVLADHTTPGESTEANDKVMNGQLKREKAEKNNSAENE